jgi:hypothetical protein
MGRLGKELGRLNMAPPVEGASRSIQHDAVSRQPGAFRSRARLICSRQRVWTLRKSGHEAAIDLRAVPGVGAEIVLTVDGELPGARLYRAHEQAELSGGVADSQATFEAKGWGA